VGHLEERDMSTLTLEETGSRLNCHMEYMASPLYRNAQARWSDGRIHHRRKPRRSGQAGASPAFTRDSPMRTPSLKREKRLSTISTASAQARISVNNNEGNFDPDLQFVEEPLRNRLNRNSLRSMSVEESVEMGVDVEELLEDDLIQMNTPIKSATAGSLAHVGSASRNSLTSTEASNLKAPNNRIMELKSEQLFASMEASVILESPKRRRAGIQSDPNHNAMEESRSTMASSLERSLEMAAAHSDGLSDKETKLKAAKFTFKTHRRTSSNPTYSVAREVVCETSTESDNDPVYC
jgi:hypothetical protein